ncbi:MAG: acylphosphatase [Actinobacteria bacterium]|nr:acylphosphatase [Actinomycetota bacterium]
MGEVPGSGADGAAAVRAVVRGRVQGVGFREATVRRARSLGVLGWVRNRDDGAVELHAEGPAAAVAALTAFLREGPRGAEVAAVEAQPVRVEGHEQFAVRGVSAGRFAVLERVGGRSRFELRLEVDGGVRAWALPKRPSMDPADKRFAVELAAPEAAGGLAADPGSGADATVWDRGPYEQGGRVPWPEALERGHAVFVLHGEQLRGGFALQRTRGGDAPQWLLVKRRDEHARRETE